MDREAGNLSEKIREGCRVEALVHPGGEVSSQENSLGKSKVWKVCGVFRGKHVHNSV